MNNQVVEFDVNKTAKINTIVNQILADEVKDNAPSVQYLFFDEENIINSFRAGLVDIENELKPTVDTTYNAFSVTKTFTALAILQLSESKKIDIDKPVFNYLPNFCYGKEITVKQLLNHTSGIPNPIPLSWIHLVEAHQSFDRNEFFRAVFKKNRKVKSRSVGKFSYSNLGYVVLGQIIENVSGKLYEDYVTENIIQRLNLECDDLAFTITDENNHAKGYHKKQSFSNFLLGFLIDKNKFMTKAQGKWRSFKNFYVNGISYGGLIGKPQAFMKYIQALIKEDSVLISSEYKNKLLNENQNSGMCLSWFTGELNSVKYYAHAGGGGGYYSEIRFYPDIKRGSVVFFNRTGMSDERYLDKVDKYYISQQL